ncbi:MAG: YqjF family protein [Gemmatimonadaceae bacterium]
MSETSRRVFLTGEWRWLAMLNYQVDAALLEPFVPRGTTLDRWRGATYVSLVGFLFRDTRVLGVPVPLHRDFEEVNLRFYVRREVDGEVRRGVTFIREIVPRRAIAIVARLAYNEPYVARSMRHAIAAQANCDAAPSTLRYEWRQNAVWNALTVEASGTAAPIAPESETEFITEHYWGYTRQRDGGTVEYHVTHPRWRTWTVDAAAVQGDLAGFYGAELGAVLQRPPHSAFLAEGSAIAVHLPARLPR